MEELKTLQDIWKDDFYELTCTEKDVADALRQEAIKWIKELSSNNTIVSNGYPITDERSKTYILHGETILWIKHFFNITDGDNNGK